MSFAWRDVDAPRRGSSRPPIQVAGSFDALLAQFLAIASSGIAIVIGASRQIPSDAIQVCCNLRGTDFGRNQFALLRATSFGRSPTLHTRSAHNFEPERTAFHPCPQRPLREPPLRGSASPRETYRPSSDQCGGSVMSLITPKVLPTAISSGLVPSRGGDAMV